MQVTNQMQTDWNAFFDGTPSKQAVSWGGGKLQNMGDGRAYFSAADMSGGGGYLNRSDINNPERLRELMAQSPGINQEWSRYGLTPDPQRVAAADAERKKRNASGMGVPGIPVHGNDADANAAYFKANPNDPIASFVRDWTKNNPSAAHQGTDWSGQYNLSPPGSVAGLGGATGGNTGGASSAPASATASASGGASGRTPYLQEMGRAIQAQSNQNLQQNILPGIGQGAQAAGMYGSSRQGTAEGIAMGNAQVGTNAALANMYLQGYGQDQQYNLGLGSLALGNKNSDQGFYTQQRGQDLQQVGLGASLFGQGNQWMLNQGQGIYNLGLTGQQAPWQSMQNFGNVSQPYTGFGSSSQNQSGSAGAGFLGGALAGSQAYNIFSK